MLCKILESRWIFKIVQANDVLIFHSLIQFVRALRVLTDVWHVKSGSPLSFPACSNKIKSRRFIEILWAFFIQKKNYSTRACWIWDDYSHRWLSTISYPAPEADPGEGPLLFVDQTRCPKGPEKFFFETGPTPFLRVWMTPLPPAPPLIWRSASATEHALLE